MTMGRRIVRSSGALTLAWLSALACTERAQHLEPPLASLDPLANLKRGEDRVSGRVVDESGQPLAGVQVWLVPDRDTLAWMGFDWNDVTVEPRSLPLDRFSHVSTDTDGSFHLESARWRDGRRITAMDTLRDPVVIALHETHAPTIVSCGTASREDGRLRDVVLDAPAAMLVARVVDETGAPISGADFRVRRGRGASMWTEPTNATTKDVLVALQRARSDAEGGVVIRGLEPGESEGLVEEATHTTVYLKRFLLVANGSVDLGDVVLRLRSNNLAGRIEDAQGRPLAGADVIVADRAVDLPRSHADLHGLAVSILGWGSSVHTLVTHSGADGSFVAGPLDSPSVTVLAEANGFEPGLIKACTPAAGPVTIALAPKREFVLRVRDRSNGAAVIGAHVVAAACEPNARIAFRFTDRMAQDATWAALGAPDGGSAFLVRGGCAEPLLVTVEAPGYATTQTEVSCPDEGQEAIVSLDPEASVTGRAVAADGAPLEGVEVNFRSTRDSWLINAWRGPPNWRGPSWTGPDGSFRIVGLGPGEWELMLDGVDRSMRPRVIQLAAGQQQALGDVAVPRCGRISGRVVLPDGTPGAGFDVRASDGKVSGMGGGRKAVSDAEGRFTLDGLEAGSWEIQARKFHGFLSHDNLTVELGDGESRDIEVPGLLGPRVVGRVLADGQPVPRAHIAISQDGGDSWSTFDSIASSSADGSFDCEFWEDRPVAILAIAPWGGSSRPITSTSTWNEVMHSDLVLADGELSGVVRDEASGQPLAGLEVELLGPWWDGCVDPLRTDEAGRFRFDHVSANEYRIRCSDPSGASATLEAGPWRLSDDQRLDDLELRVSAAASIVGTLTWGDGVLAPNGAVVNLFVPDKAQPSRWVETLAGRFTFDRLAPGDYEVGVGPAPRGDMAQFSRRDVKSSIAVQLKPGEVRELRLDLPPP